MSLLSVTQIFLAIKHLRAWNQLAYYSLVPFTSRIPGTPEVLEKSTLDHDIVEFTTFVSPCIAIHLELIIR